MSAASKVRVAIAGNPNSGKTTIFNALTGSRQKVANYPGVTVEIKEGVRRQGGVEYVFYDLPGIYSLTAHSADERIARGFIVHQKPDVIINIIDTTSLERGLYHCLELCELGLPVIGALNMADQAHKWGIAVDERVLIEAFSIPFIKTVGARGTGLEGLLEAVRLVACQPRQKTHPVLYGPELEREIGVLQTIFDKEPARYARYPWRWLAIKAIEKDAQIVAFLKEGAPGADDPAAAAAAAAERLERHFSRDSEIVLSEERYRIIRGVAARAVRRSAGAKPTATAAIDAVLLNRFAGPAAFFLIIWTMFQATFKLGELPVRLFEEMFEALASMAAGALPQGFWRSFVADGLIPGVGGVFSFVPLITLLFLFISIMEDTGYIARAAFVMDKFLHLFGLHGQSFLPLMLGFGCSVPAVMAARTLKNTKDRILTVLVTPFMSCGAKLPVYVLLAGAFFPKNPGGVVMTVYLIGFIMALASSCLFQRILFKGAPSPFVLELPPYRMPTLRGVFMHVRDKVWQYVKRAGTVILLASALIWVATTYPKADSAIVSGNKAAVLEYSLAGRIGKIVEPLVRPLGFDWKMSVSALTGFAAKEISVSTLSILYQNGDAQGAARKSLREALREDRAFTPLVAFVLMLFTLIIAPCFSALAAIRSETGARWLAFNLVYTFIAAYAVCFGVYQIGRIIW